MLVELVMLFLTSNMMKLVQYLLVMFQDFTTEKLEDVEIYLELMLITQMQHIKASILVLEVKFLTL